MPAKNSIKQFLPNSYYHLYNRGVEKRNIFLEPQDYSVLLSYLKTYLLPKDQQQLQSVIVNPKLVWREKDKAIKILRMNNFAESLSLLAYCLMPNHFHFLVKQTEANTIDRFTNSLFTRYSMYFNRKYKRVGTLFQGVYKAVLVSTDEQLLHLSRYIHQNPAPQGLALRSYDYHSYPIYLGSVKSEWVKPDEVLSHFSSSGYNSYEAFVEDTSLDAESQSQEKIFNLIFDD